MSSIAENSPLHDDDEDDICPPNPFLSNSDEDEECFGLEEQTDEDESDGPYEEDSDEDDDDSDDEAMMASKIQPLELSSSVDDDHYLNDEKPPPPPPILNTMLVICYILPLLISTLPLSIGIRLLHSMLQQIWTTSFFWLHFAVQLLVSKWMYRRHILLPHARQVQHKYTLIQDDNQNNATELSPSSKWRQTCTAVFYVLFILTHIILDIILFQQVYPLIINGIIDNLFVEPDDTIVLEYSDLVNDMRGIVGYCHFVVNARIFSLIMGVIMIGISFGIKRCKKKEEEDATTEETPRASNSTSASMLHFKVHRYTHSILSLFTYTSIIFLTWSILSLSRHVPRFWNPPTFSSPILSLGNNINEKYQDLCDPLDTTECSLPFPSMYYMKKDKETETGWRVDLHGQSLPPLKGNLRMDPTFLNDLDGFSTMAPILFYLDGLKEGHDAKIGTSQLRGVGEIHLSITSQSVTLLLDVQARRLIPHIAEIDHIDDVHYPLVLVTPAKPLDHNKHYALAVVNAVDGDGKRLSPTAGLIDLLELRGKSGSNPSTVKHAERAHRFKSVVIPSLTQATSTAMNSTTPDHHPWFDYESDPSSLQLLFDFHTVSESSQIGTTRMVRDATLEQIKDDEWGGWGEHNVRVIKVEEKSDECDSNPNNLIARTVHGELNVPWFLQGYGPGHRGAFLDSDAVSRGKSDIIGAAKFVVHVPCSVRAAALGFSDGKELVAIMEFGHGLFYHRKEASDFFLQNMANENGYLIMAMDWRGMSLFDLPVVFETLMSKPRMFQAVRDNLIQGYASKLALQHFSQNGMLGMDWLRFGNGVKNGGGSSIRTREGQRPPSTFYGISQGGILGAGYSAIMGSTGLIDRSVLGVPGTPFALILTRSQDFATYDTVLLLNFYHNRHVRMLLSVVQMAWDSVEGSGVLAGPISEPYPKVLMQAGLGDTEVPTIAAEALARAYGASTLPGNPRKIYNLPIGLPANDTYDGPHAVLTEILYKKEYSTYPRENTRAQNNRVHFCVRNDKALTGQVVEFINSGRIIDPCESDNCTRIQARC